MRKAILISAFLVLAGNAEAQTQWLPLEGRAYVDINGLYQAHSQELAQQSTFSLYDEQGRVDTKHGVDNGGVWDVGFGYRVWRELSVGLGISQFQKPGSAGVSGSVPHPLFFNSNRSFGKDLTTDHKSRAIYVQAMWTISVPDFEKLRVAMMAGIAHLRVTQELVSGANIAEVGSPYSSVNVTPVVYGNTKSRIGLMIGTDIQYVLHTNVGAGLLLRYIGGHVELPGLQDEKVKVDAAGFQVGGGVRLRF